MSRITDNRLHDLSFETIDYKVHDYYAEIVINRPEALNSLNFLAFLEINEALQQAAWDDNVCAVVLSGIGDRAFCAGADLKEHYELCSRPRDYHKWIQEFINFQTRLVNLGKPTIAKLNGLVIGAGNEINLACDLSVAADDVIIRQAGTARGSVAAIGVTQWLPITVGERRAKEILLLCEDIPAKKALEWGLINRVCPREELDDVVAKLAGDLVHKFHESTRQTLVQTNYWKNIVWGTTSPHAADWLSIHSGAPETREGMKAFMEKRDVDHMGFREKAVNDQSPEFYHGAPKKECGSCHSDLLPEHFKFCGYCGERV